ncbi:acetyltransferase [[Actinobacillus] muris]|uniref:Acetyltransferase n=1 Tax=Muribacter muris TaxID=67855 RepID=A0A0J5P7F0_9PAST|nr:GNAT family N-acetyltransferase [Muribacter muris]KMK52171.1 acetyltransferase [[Actinobacillus] muris] [Muribacter muris]
MSVIHQPSLNQFIYLTDEGQQGGVLAYRYLSETKIEAFHTKVVPELQGKGIAGELYNALIAFALQQHLKIKPSCSYVEAKMRRNHSALIG